VNKDCTAIATINVLVNGQLQRTADLALVYDSDGNHARMIFQSLKLPDGTNIPRGAHHRCEPAGEQGLMTLAG
jgi:hypothetical protein